MKIALIGYGKMGHAIEKVALEKGHEILYRIDVDNYHLLEKDHLSLADVAIEFTTPDTAFDNICRCFDANIPVVCGTTGWLKKWDEITRLCRKQGQSLVYASNYSVGVNIFFEINKFLAGLMESQSQYDVQMEEIHHTQKKDAPSGTAITLAEQILQQISRKKDWVNSESDQSTALSIISKRVDPAPGTHIVKYTSPIDDVEIIHTAHSREGFAAGAVTAAEWIIGKKGVFGMKDVLGF
jgi:4-hydroxy-tetrahydrodipicolinate reductase